MQYFLQKLKYKLKTKLELLIVCLKENTQLLAILKITIMNKYLILFVKWCTTIWLSINLEYKVNN